MSMAERKGITPVIGVVLLILITTGAVATVYSQFNALSSDRNELDELNQDTDISIVRLEATGGHTAGDKGGYVNLTLTNTGSVSRNSTAFTLTAIDSQKSTRNTECFSPETSKIIDPADSYPDNGYECNTTIRFPDPTESVTFEVGLIGSGKTWTKRCSPRRTSSTVCS